MYSIHHKLNASINGGMFVVLLATAVFLHLLISQRVESVFDDALYDKANALVSLTELDEEGLEFEFARQGRMPEFESGESPQYFQLWLSDAESLLKSTSLADSELNREGLALGQHRISDTRLADGRAGRRIEIAFMPQIDVDEESDEDYVETVAFPVGQPVTLVLARERESLDATLFAIAATIGGVFLVVLLFSALMVRKLVVKGLAPLSRLASQVSKIDESKLGQKLAHQGEQSIEIAPIENQLNHLLERLHSVFEREKRFSSNVAHELRTPLSELKTLAEVAHMVPEDPAQVAAFFADVSEISAQMEKIVITLLQLARSDAGLLRSDPEDIELNSFCDLVWEQSLNGQRQDKSLVKQIPDDLVISTDREKLGMILGNLFVNAVSYSPENAQVHITAQILNNRVVVEVKNSSMDLKPEDIIHMKDRFWRKQKSSGNFDHSGLGLSLVDALARIMNLEVSFRLEDKQTFLVTISGLSPASQS